jgi:hypothetical protein
MKHWWYVAEWSMSFDGKGSSDDCPLIPPIKEKDDIPAAIRMITAVTVAALMMFTPPNAIEQFQLKAKWNLCNTIIKEYWM